MLRWEESVTPKQQTRKIRDVDKDGFVTLKWKKDKPKTRKASIRDVIATKKTQQDKFVELAELHFFYSGLEMVVNKYWFSKGNANIFIIGEMHNTRNFVGNGTYEAFYAFMRDLERTTTSVDIMLEISDDSIDREVSPPEVYRPEVYQITNIRSLLHKCIRTHNCGKVKVHWVDGDYSKNPYMISNRFSPTLRPRTIAVTPPKKTRRNALDEMPAWIKSFYEDNYREIRGELIQQLSPELVKRFSTISGMLTLLTENTIVVKEICKATRVNPDFHLEFAQDYLIAIIFQSRFNVFTVARCVMDIYTVARMIKSHMKNVIVYVGAAHSINISNMLLQLDYTMNEKFPNSPEDLDELDYMCAFT